MKSAIPVAWGRILRGQKPLLSIEIAKECPLQCSGCYALSRNTSGILPSGAQLVDDVFSLFTAASGNDSAERLTSDDRAGALAELATLAQRFSKERLPQPV
jgi:hypothetical protein